MPPPRALPTRETDPGLWEPPAPGERHHAPQPRNPGPMNGGRGGYGPYRSQGGGGSGYVVQHGIYVPLQGISPADPLEGGYGFCDRTDGGATAHPGVDCNAGPSCNSDEGAVLVAPTDATVLAVLWWDGVTQGEGNHFWLLADDERCWQPAWVHFDHCLTIDVREGQRVTAGQRLGTCGRTGGWDCAHSHEEFCKAQPSSWWLWPYGWSQAAVEATYYDPGVWYANTVARAAALGQGEDDVPTTVSPEELAAMAPYFATYGVQPNMGTAIMARAGLAYKRDETPGPCLTDEYPYGEVGYVRQDFTARTAEWHPDDGQVYWVEINKENAPR